MKNFSLIAGIVGQNDPEKPGDGFIIRKDSKAGHYTVKFDPPLKELGGFTATQIYLGDGDTRDNVVLLTADKYEVRLKTGNSSGSGEWRDFSFIAAVMR